MASNDTIQNQPPQNRLQLILIAVCVVVVSLLIAYLEFGPKPDAQEIQLTDAAKSYIGNLKLSDIKMDAKLDYFGQKVVEIQGNIGNAGDRGLNIVEVYCIFRDYDGVEIQRERAAIVSEKMGGLAPGEMKAFRLPFDSVPGNWNQQMPQLVIAGIAFE